MGWIQKEKWYSGQGQSNHDPKCPQLSQLSFKMTLRYNAHFAILRDIMCGRDLSPLFYHFTSRLYTSVLQNPSVFHWILWHKCVNKFWSTQTRCLTLPYCPSRSSPSTPLPSLQFGQQLQAHFRCTNLLLSFSLNPFVHISFHKLL